MNLKKGGYVQAGGGSCQGRNSDPGCPLQIGERVGVGHQAMPHGCTVGAGALIGIQAIVLNNATSLHNRWSRRARW